MLNADAILFDIVRNADAEELQDFFAFVNAVSNVVCIDFGRPLNAFAILLDILVKSDLDDFHAELAFLYDFSKVLRTFLSRESNPLVTSFETVE